jgi:acyl-CoA thioesterase-1
LVGGIAIAAPPVRIMPLGDSLTHGYQLPGGYRTAFADAARRAHFSFTFVGSQENGGRHEGHPGWRIRQLQASVDGWLAESRPDLILLLIGTNDILMEDDLAHAPARLSALIEHLPVPVIVSTLPPLADPRLEVLVQRFNDALPGVVDALVKRGRRVKLVDLGALVKPADLVDGIHLNAEANRRLGEAWFRAIR